MKTENKEVKRIVVTIGSVCIVLSILLVGVVIIFATVLSQKDLQIANLENATDQQQSEIDALKQQISNLQDSDIANLTRQLAEKDAQIANLTNQNTALTNQIASLEAQINYNLSLQEKIRDSVMDYVKFNHPETAQFMNELSWTGGKTTSTGTIGAETFVYTSNGWKFTINYPVVPNPLYNVTADYSSPFTGIPYRIIWKGSWQNWQIAEDSYVFAQ